MPDTPTNNFCTLNPIEPVWGAVPTISNGNLDMAGSAATVWNNAVATFKTLPSTGKWIWAAEPNTSGGGQCDPWIVNETGLASRNNYVYVDANGWETTFDSSSVHTVLNNGAGRNASFTYGSGDFHVVCFDADSKKLWFGVFDVSAGTLQFHDGSTGLTGDPGAGSNQTFTLTGNEFSIGFATYTGRGGNVDFGQSDLLSQITIPTGFQTLCTANLPDPTIADPSAYFQTSLWNGNGSTQTITQSGNSTFEPGMIWSKARNAAQEHVIFDQVRGTTKYIQTDNAGAEGTQSGVTAFNSDGFDLGSWAVANGSGQTHVGWQWKANGSGSSNTDGSVNSTVSHESTANFSIVKYTGTGSGNSTVGHGLGTTPTFIICKHLDRSQNWRVFHTSAGVGKTGFLNDTAAFAADPDRISAVSSTTFTAAANMNESADYIAYCFADVEGYSKFGNYIGNGSTDGPFVYTGFKPALVILKVSSNAPTGWIILDNERDSFNSVNHVLQPNSSNAEASGSDNWDFNSNGFKVRNTWAAANGSGYTVTYMVFAESPFKTATAR